MNPRLLLLGVLAACGHVNSIASDAAFEDSAYEDAGIDAPPDAYPELDISCKALAARLPTATSGVYMIDPDLRAGPIAPFNVYCDMSMDHGGWTLAMALNVDTGDMWSTMTPSFAQPTSPTSSSPDVLDYSAIVPMGVTQMMLMADTRLLKFYYPRPATDFTSNYRNLTERMVYNPTLLLADAPNTGGARDSVCGHIGDACTTSDFALFKTADPSCGRDATNSYPAWGDCPGNGVTPPSPTPNCWFYGGMVANAVPTIAACPTASQAPWATYTVGTLTGLYTLWLR